MSDEDWVEAAMTDDTVVVELLLCLHQAATPLPPSKTDGSSHPPALPLEWSVRQRRSKPPILHRAEKKPTPRASPTTPLSWSGATSVSGGDGFEESSRPPPPPKPLDATRSKVTAASETTTNKRTRKKKTLAELKEEEILLVKERRHLKRELATLRVAMEKERATNESLKRLKLDLESQPALERVTEVETIHAQQKVASLDQTPPILPPEARIDDHHNKQQHPAPKGSSQLQQDLVHQADKFVMPDLNLPLEDDSNS